jgi:hypothetical protein
MGVLNCPACGAEFSLSDRVSGNVKCPRCDCVIASLAPTRVRHDMDDEDDSTVPSAVDEWQIREKHRRQQRNTMFVVVGVIGCLFLLLIGVVVIARLSIKDQAQLKPIKKLPEVANNKAGPNLPAETTRAATPSADPTDQNKNRGQALEPDPLIIKKPNQEMPRDATPEALEQPPPADPKTPAAVNPSQELVKQGPNPNKSAANHDAERLRMAQELRLRFLPQAAGTRDEITRLAKALAELDPKGKKVACRELCNAWLRDPGKNLIAKDALQEINLALFDCVKEILIDRDIKVIMSAARRLAVLGDNDAPEAAVAVLWHLKRHILPNARLLGAKVDYANNPDAGAVLDILMEVVKDDPESRQARDLRESLKDCLSSREPNWYVRIAAARHYPKTDTASKAAPILANCLSSMRKIAGKQRDELCVTLIQGLTAMESDAREAIPVLKQFADTDGSQSVRNAAEQACKQLKREQ